MSSHGGRSGQPRGQSGRGAGREGGARKAGGGAGCLLVASCRGRPPRPALSPRPRCRRRGGARGGRPKPGPASQPAARAPRLGPRGPAPGRLAQALPSTMRGSQTSSSPPGAPGGSLEGLDLSLTGLPPPTSRRPNSASAAKPMACSVSVAAGEPKRKAMEATGPINNLRRSSSTTQVHQPQARQAWAGPPRPAAPPDGLTLPESSPGGEEAATWNVLDDQPRALPSPPAARSPCALDAPAGPRRREGAVPLAPSFTANNRSNKAAVGNCVTTMVHNNHTPAEPAAKSSNRTAPSLNNLVKAATREGAGGGGRTPGNSAGAGGLLRRRAVTEEEAERYIRQVNQAAVTIQRWFRHQARRRRAHAASPGRLPASKPEGGQQKRQAEAARRKAREEKARQARRAAIQELQQRRAQKSRPAAQEAGKPRAAQEPGDSAQQASKANNTGASFRAPGPEDPCQPVPDTCPEAGRLPEDKPQDAGTQDAAGEALGLGGPGGRAQCRATLDELLDTLRLLEEAPEPLPRPRASHKDRYAWSDEEDDAGSLTADNLERLGKLSALAGPPEDGTLLSEAKLQSIRCFLDEMEQSGRERPADLQGLVLEEGPRRLESGSEASASVMRLKLEVEEKKQAMGLLQRALAQQRDLTLRRVKETEKELGRQLRQQREHYEATIQRHLSFIDQEIKQLKELMSATEKARREKWMSEKTRKIKEITVRGLEPEVQKLIARHKQEVKRLRGLHAAELLQADERAAQRYGRQAEALREQLEQEKEALAQQERARTQQRFEQQLEQEQRELQQLRRRLYGEVAEEKERLGQQAARQRAELEGLRQQLEETSAARARGLRAELDQAREELEQRHQMELQALREQLEVERRLWEANCAKKEEAWLLSRERELKEEIRRGRDKDIELVIRRLEADMTQAREESERATESRVKRLRDQHEAELLELEQVQRRLQDQCAQLRGRLAEAEGEGARLQGLLRQKDKALAEVKAVNEQLVGERSGLAQVLRQEFADRLAASEEENRRVRAELAELRARQRLELEQLRREKQAELEDVHVRVKAALAKKEEAVNSLWKQHQAAVKRADHLEELLEQRRRPLPSAK
ncbi:centrosomal protein of 131 kDa isoform X2 [Pipistrellus kuhlii]|uniref:centrosomal protein of 131 kDa isoform X2 n=1 Tax=Pipistrellus kuhlii TaxID=59472 RepID=UPI001E26F7FA|nr:centrosomal protein of 131 kDa isoform X2 [Pipistrellus kuhlii]